VKCINFIRKPKQYSRNSVALTVTEYVIDLVHRQVNTFILENSVLLFMLSSAVRARIQKLYVYVLCMINRFEPKVSANEQENPFIYLKRR
jgi:hypothetical protein